ncbi:MAG: DUF4405 domain-containing protein [Verrucomicrobiae bacterium]|nr:DUF4405 domain-containing protein [Verrucomicrobiae bacterium]NNJ42077.1 DUF4405 domain-containing protein [Akkermansiaceae bacterium]
MDRKTVNLMMLLAFGVMVVSGVMAFFLPFSIKTTGLHALMGFVFLGLIVLHLGHNSQRLRQSAAWKRVLGSVSLIALLSALFIWQPAPIRAVLSTSENMGAALEMFEMDEEGAVYRYAPAENYKLKLQVEFGVGYHEASPPEMAIWLENKSSYHIKTLHRTASSKLLPYWDWKVREYEAAKEEAEQKEPENVDVISSATPNASFDPRDYILPERNTEPFYLLIEINQVGDFNQHYADQPSIIYRVEIDNAYPNYYQVLDVVGYSKFNPEEDAWDAYYPDGTLTTCLKLIDSALLVISRSNL